MGDQETIANPESGAGAAVLRADPGPLAAAPDRFDAFISYSHTA